jgi:hypothetical protein
MVTILRQSHVRPETLTQHLKKTPCSRLFEQLSFSPCAVEAALKYYDWFLKISNRPEEELVKWIAEPLNRKAAFERAEQFGACLFRVVLSAARERVRFLVM